MLHLTSADLKQIKTESLVIPVCEDKNIYDKNLRQFVDTKPNLANSKILKSFSKTQKN